MISISQRPAYFSMVLCAARSRAGVLQTALPAASKVR
jgi:hypothetical protein